MPLQFNFAEPGHATEAAEAIAKRLETNFYPVFGTQVGGEDTQALLVFSKGTQVGDPAQAIAQLDLNRGVVPATLRMVAKEPAVEKELAVHVAAEAKAQTGRQVPFQVETAAERYATTDSGLQLAR